MSQHALSLPLLLALFFLPLASNGQTTIVDIQQVNVQGNSDQSPLLGQEVEVSGVVIASAENDNLGGVFIQQPGVTEWGGIQLLNNTALADLKIGEAVTVRGTVSESFGFTVLNNVTEVVVTGVGNITPLTLNPTLFSTYSLANNERYEGMLVKLENPDGLLRVVQVNADGPNNNFAEWRIGNDLNNPTEGCRIVTGKLDRNTLSSLNVSYINDNLWVGNAGRLNVPAIIVTTDTMFQTVTGVVNYNFGNLKLLPRNNADFVTKDQSTSVATRPSFLTAASVSPNPARDHSQLRFTLEKPNHLEVRLYDMAGRQLQQIAPRQYWLAGTHSIDLTAINTLSSGQYLLRISSDDGTYGVSMLKL